MPEALYLRDHIIRQFELAAATDDPAERAARCTFVVVGAGYTGTEVAAQGVLFTDALRAAHPRAARPAGRAGCCSTSPTRVLPELDERLSRDRGPGAARARRRGPDGHVGRGGQRTTACGSPTGEYVPTRTLIWCVGVRADPLVESLGLKTEKGRLVVDEYLRVPGPPGGVRLRRRGGRART